LDRDLDVVVTPAQEGPFAIDLLYPDTADGSLKRAHFDVQGLRDHKITISLTRGASSLNAMGDGGVAAVGTVTTVQPALLAILGARQDMHLDRRSQGLGPFSIVPSPFPKASPATKFRRDRRQYRRR
jgi:hypothetical protein